MYSLIVLVLLSAATNGRVNSFSALGKSSRAASRSLRVLICVSSFLSSFLRKEAPHYFAFGLFSQIANGLSSVSLQMAK